MKVNLEISIRDGLPSDVAAIASLMNELGYPTSVKEMKTRFENIHQHADFRTLVADVKKNTVGMLGLCKGFSYEQNGIYVRVLALVVKSSLRGEGIGQELMKRGEQWALNLGANRIVLTCGNREERIKAHGFYEQLGFVKKSTGFVKII
jgi:GNAT superfamily N-acetyltransferase